MKNTKKLTKEDKRVLFAELTKKRTAEAETMEYRVVIEHYDDRHDSVSGNMSFAEAVKLATETAKNDPDYNRWTRHSSVTGAIHHMNHYADLYNEGAIKILPAFLC